MDADQIQIARPSQQDPRDAVEVNSPHKAQDEARHELDEKFCQTARARSEELFAERAAKSAAARKAYDEGQKALASDLSHEAKALLIEAEAAADVAAQEIFTMKNTRMGPFEVDLHGLRVAEALKFMSQRLDADASKGGLPGIVFIYGAGHHSEGGRQHLKPSVLSELKKRQQGHPEIITDVREDWDAIEGRANPGCVSVSYSPGGSFSALLHTRHRGADTPLSHATFAGHAVAHESVVDQHKEAMEHPNLTPESAEHPEVVVIDSIAVAAVDAVTSAGGVGLLLRNVAEDGGTESESDEPRCMSLRSFLAHNEPSNHESSNPSPHTSSSAPAGVEHPPQMCGCCTIM